jgi:K+-sensing histidine kinase KdpD
MRAALMPEEPPPSTTTLPGKTPGTQYAAAAVVLGQEIATHQDRHAPGDFAHRLQQGQPAIDLNCLVSQADDARFQQRIRQRTARGKVEIGE